MIVPFHMYGQEVTESRPGAWVAEADNLLTGSVTETIYHESTPPTFFDSSPRNNGTKPVEQGSLSKQPRALHPGLHGPRRICCGAGK